MKFRLKVCQIFPPTTSASRAGDFLTQDYHLGARGGGGCNARRTKCVLNELDFHFNKHSIKKRLSLFTLSCANQLNNNLKS